MLKCERCGKYFLHLTKKQRIYCSPKCATRASMKAYREKKSMKIVGNIDGI